MAKIFDKSKKLVDRIPTQEVLEYYFLSLVQDLHLEDVERIASVLKEEAIRLKELKRNPI